MSSVKTNFEVHDVSVLKWARDLIDSSPSERIAADEVIRAVDRNELWRGRECLNLLAPEAPTSPIVRKLLSSEVGIRAAEGHIGPKQRWRSEEHTSELQSRGQLVCRLLLEKKKEQQSYQ